MDGDPTPALTGRRRTRPTSPGCRNPQQPEPGRAPLISAKPAVQSNRATSPFSGRGSGSLDTYVRHFALPWSPAGVRTYVEHNLRHTAADRRRNTGWRVTAFTAQTVPTVFSTPKEQTSASRAVLRAERSRWPER